MQRVSENEYIVTYVLMNIMLLLW